MLLQMDSVWTNPNVDSSYHNIQSDSHYYKTVW